MVGRDEAHPAHVGSQRVDVVDAGWSPRRSRPTAAGLSNSNSSASTSAVLRELDVDASHKVAATLQDR